MALGDDVTIKTLKYYYAFRRLKNFACIDIRPQVGTLLVYTKLDPNEVDLVEGFTRDMTNIGHFGTSDLEIALTSEADLERAKPFYCKATRPARNAFHC